MQTAPPRAPRGLTLSAAPTAFRSGKPGQLVLQVKGKDGAPVRAFERDQTKLMHLIVARSDFASYQHLHPTLDAATGRFTVALRLPKAGTYRAIADFTTAGKRYALGVNITATGGPSTRVALLAISATATTDGYDVRLKDGALVAGSDSRLSFTITKGDAPIADLQPYLGAAGHLVALRSGDLAYSHVHPLSADKATGSITFNADFPTPDTYRLFLQFRAGGVVHTAAFTVKATA